MLLHLFYLSFLLLINLVKYIRYSLYHILLTFLALSQAKHMLSVNKLVTNFYFHIPFCLKKCFFCAFPVHALGESTPDNLKSLAYDQYLGNMQKEVQILLKREQICQNVESIYFGGGTPSLLAPNNIQPILNYFSKKIKKSTEITLEMNPQQIPKAQQFISIGINRLSIGIQTLSPAVNKTMNRSPIGISPQDFIQKLIKIRLTATLNLDIIINFNDSAEIDNLFSLIQKVKPHHLSCYILQINQGSYLFRNPEKYNHFIDNYGSYQAISKKLEIFGYDHYEVSNFCLKGYESKHNNAYWKGDKPFAAFGMGSTSLLNSIRVTKPKNLSKYYKYVNEMKKNEAEIRRNKYESILQYLQIHSECNPKQTLKWIILSRLRKKQGIEWKEIREKLFELGYRKEKVDQKIQDCKKMLVELNNLRQIVDIKSLDSGIKVQRPQGYLFVDQIGYRIIDLLKI